MSDKNVNLIKQFLSSIPNRYNDKSLDLIYRHGYLIALLARICADNPKIKKWIEHEITKSK